MYTDQKQIKHRAHIQLAPNFDKYCLIKQRNGTRRKKKTKNFSICLVQISRAFCHDTFSSAAAVAAAAALILFGCESKKFILVHSPGVLRG